jgi:hypothetical protein
MWREIWTVYGGGRDAYGGAAGCFALIPLLGLLSLALTPLLRRQAMMRSLLLATAVIVLVLPFVPNLLSGGTMPYRSLIGVPVALWVMTILALEAGGARMRMLGVGVALLAGLQILVVAGRFQAADAMAARSDERLAAMFYVGIETARAAAGDVGQTKVEFFGAPPPLRMPYPQIETVGARVFDWDGGNPIRIVALYKVLGYAGIDAVSPEERRRLLPQFATMGAWPATTAVRVVDGVTLVKLGDQPDFVHAAIMTNHP